MYIYVHIYTYTYIYICIFNQSCHTTDIYTYAMSLVTLHMKQTCYITLIHMGHDSSHSFTWDMTHHTHSHGT